MQHMETAGRTMASFAAHDLMTDMEGVFALFPRWFHISNLDRIGYT